MGDITKNINRSELACACGCGFDSMDINTVIAWQAACDHFARKARRDRVVLYITSAARCYAHNANIGSTDKSQHPRARAIDGRISGVSVADLYAYFDKTYPGQYGIGLYEWGVHLDTRTNGPARW